MHRLIFIFSFFFFSTLFAQTSAPFSVYIEPFSISGLGGLQSFAHGESDGKWLIVGGRLDGLHLRQPFASFGATGNNNQIIVVDPVSLQKWSAPLSTLPISIQEQLSSTNMNFHQEGDYLYCVGGYGYSNTSADHITYPKLTAIKVSDVIQAVINNTPFSSFFRQISDSEFEVTGGHLKKINDVYHLLGGHKFIGRYNPMGPTHGPGFIQEYTNAVRRFKIVDDGVNITIQHLTPFTDNTNLHRRDYNALAQILPSGEEGITLFSGVFQTNADLPFLNSVTVNSSTYSVNNSFQQYYNHYHCATIPIYSVSNNAMHNLFFGGIAQYYDNAGTLVQDNNVPFVKTIARVTRDASGTMAEYKLPIEMPALLGSGSEFIMDKNVPHYNNDVIQYDNITTDTTLIGYIYGGISSTASNIFFINDGTQSSASNQLFKVFLIKNNITSIDDLNEQSIGSLKMMVYPNPNNGKFLVTYYLKNTENVWLRIQDSKGKLIEHIHLQNQQIGENSFSKILSRYDKKGMYFVTIETPYEKATQKVILEF